MNIKGLLIQEMEQVPTPKLQEVLVDYTCSKLRKDMVGGILPF